MEDRSAAGPPRRSAPVAAGIRGIQRVARTRGFARVARGVVHHLDRAVFRVSGGRAIVSDLILPVAMVTTTGRRSGRPRTVPVVAVPTPEGWLVVGSNFGQPHDPAWVRNLEADPRAVVRRRGRTTPVVAEELDATERHEVWPLLTAYWPPFDDYVERAQGAGRTIRVLRLRPRAAGDDRATGDPATGT